MDLLRDNVRAVYRKYFLAAFGSALISCIYGVVDMAMVGHPQAGRCVFCLRRAGARHQRRTDFAAAGGARAGCELVGHAGHGSAGRLLCRVGRAARDAGAAVVLKPGLSAYTPFIGGDVHEALESLFVRGGIPAADGGEDDRPGGGRRCARGAAAGHQRRR